MTEAAVCKTCGKPIPADSPERLCPACLLQAAISQSSPDLAQAVAAAEVPTTAEIAQRLPQLEIVELLGRGGMGAVYRARQANLDRDVAVKVLTTTLAKDPSFTDRFELEARALARLAHPNIVAVYEFGKTSVGELHYMVMEFVDGSSLRHLLRQGLLTPEQALAIVPQICLALQYAHEQGIVHRDIKPENVLIDRKGHVKIADFGLAKMVSDKAADRPAPDAMMTQVSQRMGTPVYMAPEQIEDPLRVDHRADIYSLGVVFYEMLTGELPLGRFELPSQKAQIDVRLDEVVIKSLEKKRELRYQRADALGEDVETIASSEKVLTRRARQRWSTGHVLLLVMLLLSLLPLWSGLSVGPIRAVEPIGLSGVRAPRISMASAWYPGALALLVIVMGAWTLRRRAPVGAWTIPLLALVGLGAAAFAPYRAGPLLQHSRIADFSGRFEFLPNGHALLCTRGQRGLIIVDPLTAAVVQTIATPSEPARAVVSPKGDRLAIALWETDDVLLYDLTSNRPIATHRFAQGTLPVPQFSPDGKQFVVCVNDRFSVEVSRWMFTADSGLFFFDAADGAAKGHFHIDHPYKSSYEPLDWHGDTLAICNIQTNDQDSRLWLWDVQDQKLGDWFQYVNLISTGVRFSPDGRYLAHAVSCYARVWTLARRNLQWTLGEGLLDRNSRDDWTLTMDWSPDSSRLVCGYRFGHVNVWEMSSGRVLRELQIPGADKNSPITSVRFDPTGRQITVATAAGDLWVYDAL